MQHRVIYIKSSVRILINDRFFVAKDSMGSRKATKQFVTRPLARNQVKELLASAIIKHVQYHDIQAAICLQERKFLHINLELPTFYKTDFY